MKKDLNLTFWSMGKWKIANMLEIVSRRAKRSEIWDTGVISLVEHFWNTVDI